MQNLTILTAQNQVSKNPDQASALSRNNEPNISFKDILSSQAKPTEPVKTPQKTEAAAKESNTAVQADQNGDQAVKDQPANTAEANNDVSESVQNKIAHSKNLNSKNINGNKTKTQPQEDLANTAVDVADQLAITANGIAEKSADTAALNTEPKLPVAEEDQTETLPSAVITGDANAAIIAALNLPVKTAITNVTPQPDAVSSFSGQAAAAATTVTGQGANIDSIKNASAKPDVKAGVETKVTADKQITVAEPPATHGKNNVFNALLEPRFNNRLNPEQAADKTPASAFNTLTNLPTQTMLATANANSNTAATQAAAMNTINAYPGKTGWDQAISQKVVWMVGAAEQSATLTLNPPDLGPLQVVINVNNDKADTTFISQNPEVRKALEDGMSNLRQLMDQAGVQLGQTTVNDGRQSAAFQQASREQRFQQTTATNSKQAEPDSAISASAGIRRINQGLVDTFA